MVAPRRAYRNPWLQAIIILELFILALLGGVVLGMVAAKVAG